MNIARCSLKPPPAGILGGTCNPALVGGSSPAFALRLAPLRGGRGCGRPRAAAGKDFDSASGSLGAPKKAAMRTCRRCKQLFDPATNTPHSCKYHPNHFAGEHARKFEGAHTGGTMTTSGGGAVSYYWHCCGEKDATHPGCESAPHAGFGDD